METGPSFDLDSLSIIYISMERPDGKPLLRLKVGNGQGFHSISPETCEHVTAYGSDISIVFVGVDGETVPLKVEDELDLCMYAMRMIGYHQYDSVTIRPKEGTLLRGPCTLEITKRRTML